MRDAILVTAIGSFSAVTVIESLKRDGYRVIGCDIYPAEWVANSKIVDVFYKAPYATDRQAYEEFIRMVCVEEEVAFVMPLTDVEIDLFRRWENAEVDTGAVICMSDRGALEICRNKKVLEEYLAPKKVCETIPGRILAEVVGEAEGSGQQAPGETAQQVVGIETVERAGESAELAGAGYGALKYPLVIKPVDGRSSQGLHIVKSAKEMELVVELCSAELDRYLVQSKISGPIITVDVVRNPDSGEIVCMPRRELLRTPNGAGTSVYVFKNQYLEKQCRDIAEALNIRGCVNFEFVEEQAPEEKNGPGIWRFLECNPRFSGGLAFSVMAGYDMVRNHLNCFMGKTLEPEGTISDQYIARRYGEYRMD